MGAFCLRMDLVLRTQRGIKGARVEVDDPDSNQDPNTDVWAGK